MNEVLLLLLSLNLFHVDKARPAEEQRRYLAPAAEAIHHVAKHHCGVAWGYAHCVAWLATLGEAESHFASLIGQDRCSEFAKLYGPDCDRGKSKTFWQCKFSACPAAHRAKPGSREQMFAGAGAALVMGYHHFRRCKSIGGAFSGYGTGGSCEDAKLRKRAKRFRVVLSRFRALHKTKAP